MLKDDLNRLATSFAETDSANLVSAAAALRPELAGLRLFDAPLLGLASAGDPLFGELARPGVVGPQFELPEAWLPGARTVISFFLPFSSSVIASNRRDRELPSDEWLHGRMEGQVFLKRLGEYLVKELEGAGHRAVFPGSDARFKSWTHQRPSPETPAYASNWSERHVAYVCGLGTFGLSAGLITERGMAGRLGSVVTDLPAVPDARPYSRHDEYCLRCGACARNCFAGGISLAKGRNKEACSRLIDRRKEQYRPRYGCGKCQVNVPCERTLPGKKAGLPREAET
ncbi:MAG: epoxyqueuosine reductase [Planctomycetota bacterium]|jgi:epoxyqueuosine reductase QueG|nr:epoxyqueuosine reductase [Planctomycetota bacterium]